MNAASELTKTHRYGQTASEQCDGGGDGSQKHAYGLLRCVAASGQSMLLLAMRFSLCWARETVCLFSWSLGDVRCKQLKRVARVSLLPARITLVVSEHFH
jgi:hypothetical protein